MFNTVFLCSWRNVYTFHFVSQSMGTGLSITSGGPVQEDNIVSTRE